MRKRPFGGTGFDVTPVGYGGAEIGLLQPERAATARLLNLLLDEGVNLIDTAAGYKDSEEVIGGHRRGEFVLVSNSGHPAPQAQGEPWSAQLMAGTIEASLRRLRTAPRFARLIPMGRGRGKPS